MPRQDTPIEVPGGTLILTRDKVLVHDLRIAVNGQTLALGGEVKLKNFAPTRLNLRADGRISGKLLEMFLPEAISSSGGSAKIEATLADTLDNPKIEGTLTFDRPFEVAPRGLRREIVLDGGSVMFSSRSVRLNAITGSIDEGRLYADGGVRFDDKWRPVDAYVST